jgi:hypothetical protein
MADELDVHCDAVNNALDTTDIHLKRVEKNLTNMETSVVRKWLPNLITVS